MNDSRRRLITMIVMCVFILTAFTGVGYAYTGSTENSSNTTPVEYVTITQQGTNVSPYTFGTAHITYDVVATRYVETVYKLMDPVDLDVSGVAYKGVHADNIFRIQLNSTSGDPLTAASYDIKMWHGVITDIGDWKAIVAYWPVGMEETNATMVLVEGEDDKATLTLTPTDGVVDYYLTAYTSAIDGETRTPLPKSVMIYGAPFSLSTDTPGTELSQTSLTVTRTNPVPWEKITRDKNLEVEYQLKPSITTDLTVGDDTYSVVSFGGNNSYQTMTLTHQFEGNNPPSSYPVSVWYDSATFPGLGEWDLIVEYWTENAGATDVNVHKTFVVTAGENTNNDMILYPGTDGNVVYKVKLYLGAIGGSCSTAPPSNGTVTNGTIMFRYSVG